MSSEVSVHVLSGWGIAPEAAAALFPPGARVLAPTRENVAALAGARRVVGYSLGAFLLLEASARGEFFCEDVSLCAPFLAFPREAGAGGRVSATQVKFLRLFAASAEEGRARGARGFLRARRAVVPAAGVASVLYRRFGCGLGDSRGGGDR